jgi:glucokinase-like ROK family protein
VSQRNRYRTGGHALIRQINLSAILFHLRENAPISRAALAEITGLNKTTVSSLVSELIENQFVREVGLESGGVGRRAMLLRLNPAAGCIVSGEIGVDFISVIAADFAAEIIWRHQTRIDPAMGQNAIVEQATALLWRATQEGQSSYHRLLGVAVGVPGLVDQSTGALLFAPNLGWKDVPVRTILQQTFDAPVFVDNEANLAALGEHFFGAAQGYGEVLYISAGVGLGGGVVHDGQLYQGATGVAGELGHITMEPDGELCNCGNRGCWETLVSQRALFRRVKRAVDAGHASQLSKAVDGDSSRLTVPLVAEAARAGDSVAQEAFDALGHSLGIGIASLVNTLNPELVVFGGILSLGWEFLLPPVTEEIQRRALRWNREAMQVVLARHGFDACVIGGLALVLQDILREPQRTA